MSELPIDAGRFWSKVRVGGPSECWEWQAGLSSSGYGLFSIGGRAHPAHRVAWVLERQQKWPSGKFACHTCDNRRCVNPAHVWPGTPADNTHDMVAKGRHHYQREYCLRGHLYEGQRPRPSDPGKRCRICQRMKERERRAAKRSLEASL